MTDLELIDRLNLEAQVFGGMVGSSEARTVKYTREMTWDAASQWLKTLDEAAIRIAAMAAPADCVVVPVERLKYVVDLLVERKHGSPARSPAHSARLVIDELIAAAPKASDARSCPNVHGRELCVMCAAGHDERCRHTTPQVDPAPPDDDELPGMWSHADLMGGETDSAPPVAGGELAGRLREVLPELEFSRETHVVWRNWLLKDPENEKVNPHAGSAEFHSRCLVDYDKRIAVINEAIKYVTNHARIVAEKDERADKFMWQVRDTCRRAEKAEQRAEAMAGLLQKIRSRGCYIGTELADQVDTLLTPEVRHG